MTGLDRRVVAVAGHTGDVAAARRGVAADDPHVRAIAYAALHRAGALTPADLGRAAADEAAVVRRRAATLAAHHRGFDLAHLLDDPDATVVEVAAWAAGEQVDVGTPVLGRLVALAGTHDDALVRESAIAALGAIGDPAGFDAIAAGLDDVATVRRRAVLALAPFVANGDHVDELLRRAAADRDWQVRQAAEDLTSVDPRA